MANSDAVLKLLIEMNVVGRADAEAANQLLKESGKSIEEVGNKEKEASGHAEQLGLSHTALHKVMHLIGKTTAPELGQALGGLMLGPVGIAIALGAAYEVIRKKIEESKIEAEKLNDVELAAHRDSIKRIEDAWDDAAIKLADYFADYAKAGGSADPAKKQLDNIKAVTDAQIDSSKKIVEALGKQELAHMRANGATDDQISRVEERQRRDVDALDQKKEINDGSGALKREMAARQEENKGGGLEKTAVEKSLAAANAGLALKNNRDEKAKLDADLDPSNKESSAAKFEALAPKLEPLIEQLHQAVKTGSLGFGKGNSARAAAGMMTEDFSSPKQWQKAAEKLQGQLDGLGIDSKRKRSEQLTGEFGKLEQEKRAAELEANRATGASLNNAARRRELPAEIEQAEKIEREKRFGRIGQDAAAAIGRDEAAGKSTHKEAADQLKRSQAVGRELATAAKDAAAAHSDSLGILATALNDLRAANLRLQGQINGSRNRPGG